MTIEKKKNNLVACRLHATIAQYRPTPSRTNAYRNMFLERSNHFKSLSKPSLISSKSLLRFESILSSRRRNRVSNSFREINKRMHYNVLLVSTKNKQTKTNKHTFRNFEGIMIVKTIDSMNNRESTFYYNAE